MLFFGSTTVALIVSEFIARRVMADSWNSNFLGTQFQESGITEPTAELYWQLRPGLYDEILINKHRLRGSFSRAYNSKQLELLFIGDSCTFGAGIAYPNVYAIQAANRIWRDDHVFVSPTLGAVPGYSTYQNRIQLPQLLEQFDPDVVFFYVGAWNDYVAAVQAPDHELPRRFALMKLVSNLIGEKDRALTQMRASEDDEYLARVPLAQFRENIHWMIERVRRHGANPVFIIPPLPHKTLTEHIKSKDYRDALHKVLDTTKTDVLDVAELFEKISKQVEGNWSITKHPDQLLFIDWVHPSSLGHQIISDQVTRYLRQKLQLEPNSTTADISITPANLAAFGSDELTLENVMLAVDEVWLGPILVPAHTQTGSRLEFNVPAGLPAGEHEVRLRCGSEILVCKQTVMLTPPAIELSSTMDDDRRVIELKVTAKSEYLIVAWVSDATLSEPLLTDAGPFWLLDRKYPELPKEILFAPEALSLSALYGKAKDGSWSVKFPAEKRLSGSTTVFVQAMVTSPKRLGYRSLTNVVSLEF